MRVQIKLPWIHFTAEEVAAAVYPPILEEIEHLKGVLEAGWQVRPCLQIFH